MRPPNLAQKGPKTPPKGAEHCNLRGIWLVEAVLYRNLQGFVALAGPKKSPPARTSVFASSLLMCTLQVAQWPSVFASDLYKWPQWPSVFASSLRPKPHFQDTSQKVRLLVVDSSSADVHVDRACAKGTCVCLSVCLPVACRYVSICV